LKRRPATAARALEFAILTAERTGEAIGMTWREVDFESRLWTIPALRMKAEAEHSVPLTDRAMTLLNALMPKNLEAHRLVFPSQCGGKLSCWRTRSGIRPNAPIGAGGRWRSAVLSWMLGKPVALGRLVSTRQRS
jgi:integrase